MIHLQDLDTFETMESVAKNGVTGLKAPWVLSNNENTQARFYPDLLPGDIVLANDSSERMYTTPERYTSLSYAYENLGFSPIGVVVVPGSHTPNGIARMMTPERLTPRYKNGATISGVTITKGSSHSCYWGGYWDNTGHTIPGLQTCSINGSIGTSGELIEDTLKDRAQRLQNNTSKYYGLIPSDVHIPADDWSGSGSGYTIDGKRVLYGENPYDEGTYYVRMTGETATTQPLIPSPYFTDGTKNPLYEECGMEMCGRENTDKILAYRDEVESGKPDYSSYVMTNDSGNTSFIPATLCDMYSTRGTNPGDWYLPSVGELGYLAARAKRIKKGLAAINSGLGGMYGSSYPDAPTLSVFTVWGSSVWSPASRPFVSGHAGTSATATDTTPCQCWRSRRLSFWKFGRF